MIPDFNHHAMHKRVEAALVELLREEGIVYTTAQMAEMSWRLTEAIQSGCTRAGMPESPPEMTPIEHSLLLEGSLAEIMQLLRDIARKLDA